MPVSIVATRIDEMVAAAGCELWYLPPYSRLLEQDRVRVRVRIERWWFVLKNGMKRWDEFDVFRDGVDAAFKQCPNVSA